MQTASKRGGWAMNGFKKMIMADNQGFFLPKEYIELEYIESPPINGYGKCLIKTGINYRNKIIQATIQGNTSQASAYTVAFGGFQDNIPMTLLAYKNKSIGYSLYREYAASGISIDNKVDVTLTIVANPGDTPSSDGTMKVTGTMQIGDIVKTYEGGGFINNAIFLFSGGSSGPSSSWNFVGKIFKCKITELNGKVLRYFIPALRVSDSIAGMYDMVSGIFFTEAYGNKFEYGYKSI
jgi:hypothetical protein